MIREKDSLAGLAEEGVRQGVQDAQFFWSAPSSRNLKCNISAVLLLMHGLITTTSTDAHNMKAQWIRIPRALLQRDVNRILAIKAATEWPTTRPGHEPQDAIWAEGNSHTCHCCRRIIVVYGLPCCLGELGNLWIQVS